MIRYLGRYTHRIAIRNRRIVSMTDETVTYLVKDYKNGGKYIKQTIKEDVSIYRLVPLLSYTRL